MNKGIFFRILICILFLGICLYSYLDVQNEITDLRIQIPKLTTQILRIEEENTRLFYEIKSFESPENLMALAQQASFAHLKFPTKQEVLTIHVPSPLKNGEHVLPNYSKAKPSITFATGATP